MHILEILGLIFAHWVADYCTQTEEQGLGKSKSFVLLYLHTMTYSMAMFAYIVWLYFFHFVDLKMVAFFFPITLVAHTITDYFTSRLTGYYYKKNKMYGFPGFWTVIGFDQVLHYVQIFTTYYFLKY